MNFCVTRSVRGPEPLIRSSNETWEMTLDVLDVIEFGRQRVVDVDDDDLPVCLALVEESHDSKNLDLLNLSGVTDLFAYFADIQGVIVALGFGLDVGYTRVLPRLCARVSPSTTSLCTFRTHLRERAIVPDVTVVGEAVAHKAQPVPLDVLLDGVHELVLRDLHLRVRPTWHLDDHVEDAVVLVGEERNIVKRRHDIVSTLHVDSVIWVTDDGQD